MIPQNNGVSIGQELQLTNRRDQPSKTYRIDFEAGRIMGYVDGLEAVKQAIVKIVSTQRFRYRIYSWNYGTELQIVIGKSRPVLESEIRRIIREALLEDRRITDARDFEIAWPGKRIALVSFTALTVFGEASMTQEVQTDV